MKAIEKMQNPDLITKLEKKLAELEVSEAKKIRLEALSAFAEMGFPHPRLEDWKYTNVLQTVSHPWRIELNGSRELCEKALAGFDYRKNGFLALNLSAGSINFFTIGNKPDDTLLLDFEAEEDCLLCPHTIIEVPAGARATVIEKYTTQPKAFINSVVRFKISEGASLTHIRFLNESAETLHYGYTQADLGRNASFASVAINLGAGLSRCDIAVSFHDQGGKASLDGLYLLNGKQHHDTHSVIDHKTANCTSQQTYKGILMDAARGVFNGKVFVRENASGTDAQQSNKNLLLSNEARVDTKPQLEIFNDDVKCSHGATVGQLETEEIFYLKTRGLTQEIARALITYGFAEEIVNRIEDEKLRGEIEKAVTAKLNMGFNL